MILTLQHLRLIIPRCKNPADWLAPLNDKLPKYEINNINRIAAFLAQCGHESGDFNVLAEDLHYSTETLLKLFGKYFTGPAEASHFNKQPEMIANRIYADRMGNGNEASGEGWLYRGRGVIQTTGKTNYKAFGDSIGMDLKDVPAYLETIDGALESACFYWKNRGHLNIIADTGNIDTISRLVNGGDNGLLDRRQRYVTGIKVLGK
jgi:putative chitinase